MYLEGAVDRRKPSPGILRDCPLGHDVDRASDREFAADIGLRFFRTVANGAFPDVPMLLAGADALRNPA